MLDRRTMLGNSVMSAAALALMPGEIGCRRNSMLTLRRGSAAAVKIPDDFAGLGYEMSSVAQPGLLSTDNQRYVNLVKGLGPRGVVRVGGIVANYTRYDANGTIRAAPKNTVITRACIERFDGFLREVGWRAVWSLNFAQGSLAEAVEEARAVSSSLGPRLLAIELGNEVEFYNRGNHPFRTPAYDYAAYRAEYNEWRAAILKALPGMSFAAPDTAASVEWVERMASDARGDVQLLTTHYYRNGQQRGSADQLLHPDPRLEEALKRLRIASQKSGIPWRMCETNSFSGGGLPGVSDTFLAALWTLDFMLRLGAQGCAGVNMETGVNQLGFVSSYSPIQDDGRGINSAGAPYYGMLAFAQAVLGCEEMLPIERDEERMDLTTYALGKNGAARAIVMINRDPSHDAHVSIAGFDQATWSGMRLIAPSPAAKTGITFAGAAVDPHGKWAATAQESVKDGSVVVPRMSALVLRTAD